jgi:hypothetical protein
MNQEQASAQPVERILMETLDALVHLDADRLENLARSAEALQGIASPKNVTLTVTNYKILGKLLEETRCTMRVLEVLEARRYQEDARGYAGFPPAS